MAREIGHASIRLGRPGDAPQMSRVYVDAWREAYPLLLPHAALAGMSYARTERMFADNLARAKRDEPCLVCDTTKAGILGLVTAGPSRARNLKVAGGEISAEVFTLYVHPDETGRGIGRALLQQMFLTLRELGHERALVWMLKGNPARFFYEEMGGQLVARRRQVQFGRGVELEAYAWPDLLSTSARPAVRAAQRPPR